MSPSDDWNDDSRGLKAGRAAMVQDIEYEVVATRHAIGKDTLDPRVMATMAKVPREQFIPEAERNQAFRNGPVPIGHGQTISQPYIVALMTDLLRPRPDSVILEIGSGSGYQAAVLSQLVLQVYSVEIIQALADAAGERLARLGYANVAVRHGDGYAGWPEHAPYDGIIVTAAAPHVPGPLLDQLKPGARLVIPVGEPYSYQILTVLDKQPDGSCSSQEVLAVSFVPLTRIERAR